MPPLLMLFFSPASFHYDWKKKIWQPSPLLFNDLWLIIEILLTV